MQRGSAAVGQALFPLMVSLGYELVVDRQCRVGSIGVIMVGRGVLYSTRQAVLNFCVVPLPCPQYFDSLREVNGLSLELNSDEGK